MKRPALVVIPVVVLLLVAAGIPWWRQQRPLPEATITGPASLGREPGELKLRLKAAAGTLASVEVRLVQGAVGPAGSKDVVLLTEDLSARGATEVELPIVIPAEGLIEGPAEIRVVVTDNYWRPKVDPAPRLVHPLAVDLTPPVLEFRSSTRNMNRAGTGVAVYRVRDAIRSGVVVGDREFPGHAGLHSDAEVRVVLFTLPYDVAEEALIPSLFAIDEAGNSRRVTLDLNIMPTQFRRDTVKLSPQFLQRKVPELATGAQGDLASADTPTLLKAFLEINRDGRRESEKRIREASQTGSSRASGADAAPKFAGAFKQQPGSQVFAGFPEEREYRLDGEIVDTQWHLGLDLASLAASPVLASHAGKVIYTGSNGIYGNMVIVDHGLGLTSLYAHLSETKVSDGQTVVQGESLGSSGQSGLAAGDHIHFAMLVHGTYTNPPDWWDPSYIRDRIAGPMREGGLTVPGLTDLVTAESSSSRTTAPRKTRTRRR